MLKNLRFDQIFHQHYHYFGINSLQNIAKKINCEIIGKKLISNIGGVHCSL